MYHARTLSKRVNVQEGLPPFVIFFFFFKRVSLCRVFQSSDHKRGLETRGSD